MLVISDVPVDCGVGVKHISGFSSIQKKSPPLNGILVFVVFRMGLLDSFSMEHQFFLVFRRGVLDSPLNGTLVFVVFRREVFDSPFDGILVFIVFRRGVLVSLSMEH